MNTRNNKKELTEQQAKDFLEKERQRKVDGFRKDFEELKKKWDVDCSFGANTEQIHQISEEAFKKISIEMIVLPK